MRQRARADCAIRLLDACRALGNTALLRQTLRSIVDTGVLPGMHSEQPWVYPPARYVCAYADVLRYSAPTREAARSLLNAVLRRQILFDIDRMVQDAKDFDYSVMPEDVVQRSWIPSYCR